MSCQCIWFFVATTFNLMVTVRVAGWFTEGTWVTNREHFDTNPIWRQRQKIWSWRWRRPKAREGTTLSQSPVWRIAEDIARAFRWEEGAFERRESKVDWSLALERWRCWIGKSIASSEDHSGCLDEKKLTKSLRELSRVTRMIS